MDIGKFTKRKQAFHQIHYRKDPLETVNNHKITTVMKYNLIKVLSPIPVK